GSAWLGMDLPAREILPVEELHPALVILLVVGRGGCHRGADHTPTQQNAQPPQQSGHLCCSFSLPVKPRGPNRGNVCRLRAAGKGPVGLNFPAAQLPPWTLRGYWLESRLVRSG